MRGCLGSKKKTIGWPGPSRYKDILLCKSARDIFFNIKAKTSGIEDEGKRSQLIPNLAEKYL
jgi:hypothetical protein